MPFHHLRRFLGLAAAALVFAFPLAAFPQSVPAAAPDTGPAPLTVTFSPNNPNGSFYQWQFNYNPAAGFVPDYSSEVGEDISYTYTAPGTYTARLLFFDISGGSTPTDFTITVYPPASPPTVDLAFTPYPTLPNQTITFTASAQASPGRSIVAYSWDLNDDGVEDAGSGPGSTAAVTHSFEPNGYHIVTVTAVDNGGLANKATAEVRIGLPPEIIFADPTSRMTQPDTSISMTVETKFTSPWVLDHFDWDFGGGTGTPAGASATVSFPAVGNYTVSATVTDTAGHSKTATLPVEVVVSGIKLVQHKLMPDTATYTVMACPPAGSTVASYGWDFIGGTTDDVNTGTTPTVTWAKTGGDKPDVVVKAYLNPSGFLTATLPLQYFIPAAAMFNPVPITLTAAADGSPVADGATIRVGHVVTFYATGGWGPPSGRQIKELLWDFDGDGLRDQQDNIPPPPPDTLEITNVPGTYQYRNPGTFKARARIIQVNGDFGERTFTINVSPGAASLECFISQPRHGQRIWGNHVSLQAKTSPAVLTQRVEFRYSPSGSGIWTTIGTVTPPPYTSLSVTWDVTKLVPGDYDLLAVATDTSNNTALSSALQPVTVTVDPNAPEEEENLGNILVRTHTIDPNVPTRSEIAGDTAIEFPPHAFGMEYTTIRLERPFSNPHLLEARLQGLQFVPGSFRRLALDGGAGLQKPSKIALYDINPNGILDELKVDPSRLKIYQFDSTQRQWVPLFGQVVQPGEDLARATLMSMDDVGLVMEPEPRAPTDSSSGGCGFLGPEVLILALFFACRRLLNN